ncbi:hypothetical protein GP486_004631 [Trichoglossum hirsutum]|uniref:Anaphase-promoting complex subunit 2 n=1 Tax=Trichoglossum hirsutum TaxID=265104 RepID=A0A9P8RNS8_9PEZI|nr:hypothetical protein GP486_004631 [Trichoglossum hirsutum]
MQSRKRIFSSVFPDSSSVYTIPTPVATPVASFITPGQSFGGAQTESQTSTQSPTSSFVAEHIRWNRAWHTATGFLSLPDEPITFRTIDQSPTLLRATWKRQPQPETLEAIKYLLFNSKQNSSDGMSSGDDLVDWYTYEVRRHFLTFVRPGIRLVCLDGDADEALNNVFKTLQFAQRVYQDPLSRIFTALKSLYGPDKALVEIKQTGAKFRRDLHAIIAYSLPHEKFSAILAKVLAEEGAIILGISSEDNIQHGQVSKVGDEALPRVEGYMETKMDLRTDAEGARRLKQNSEDSQSRSALEARRRVISIGRILHQVGLGGARGEQVLAEIMNKLMTEYITKAFANQWQSPSTVTARLKTWMEDEFGRLVIEMLSCFTDDGDERTKLKEQQSAEGEQLELLVTFEDIEKWSEMGIGRLGRLRIGELFDIIVDWDSSMGAVEDLKYYTTTPQTRSYLTSSFSSVVSQRLLHPGASTKEILQVYISLIRAFSLLDPKGVLLDRISRPIRRYLKEREDTVKVIVAGLLADPDDGLSQNTSFATEILVELAVELDKANEARGQEMDDVGELDWDDMQWVPDPVDAGPGKRVDPPRVEETSILTGTAFSEYRKSKASDVIGSLISLYDSKDIFVKELQNVMGDRLLKKDFDFDKEIRVLELLKIRFGEGALQACEVMLRDVLDSKRVDAVIRADQNLHLSKPHLSKPTAHLGPQPSHSPELHAKILSRLFWPSLHEETFAVPLEISELQERYERGFETLKQSRKLTWLPALGQVTVELDLQDRVVTEEVQPWHASVIYAFQDPDASEGAEARRTVAELTTQLSMAEGLVRNALTFWVGKLVLKEVEKDTFSVLETLDQDETRKETAEAAVAAAAEAEASSTVTALKSNEEVQVENMKVYWQFIVGMLTNQGAMPLQGIIMMLKMAVPGGFPFSSEELREFLSLMVNDGKLEVLGGNYKIKN